MASPDIPEDIWTEILEYLTVPQLTKLQQVSSSFRALARHRLQSKILWADLSRTEEAIKGYIQHPERTGLVRAAAVQIAPEHILPSIFNFLSKFTSLQVLEITGTRISPSIYTALAIPTLSTLIINNCYFCPFSDDEHLDGDYYIDRASLQLQHLQLSNIFYDDDDEEVMLARHPICLLKVKSLTSVYITWTDDMATAYRTSIHYPGSAQWVGVQHDTQPEGQVPAPGLQLMTIELDDLQNIESLTHLTSPRTIVSNGQSIKRPPRVTIYCGRSLRHEPPNLNLSTCAVSGVWKYSGPPHLLGLFIPLTPHVDNASYVTYSRNLHRIIEDSLDINDYAEDGNDRFALRHLCLYPSKIEATDIASLLWRVNTRIDPSTGDHIRRVKSIHSLAMYIPTWKGETCCTIYTKGAYVRPQDMFSDLKSLFPALPLLHTLRIYHRKVETRVSETTLAGDSAETTVTPSRTSEMIHNFIERWGRQHHVIRTVQLTADMEFVRVVTGKRHRCCTDGLVSN